MKAGERVVYYWFKKPVHGVIIRHHPTLGGVVLVATELTPAGMWITESKLEKDKGP